jgi:3-phosphoshikimate 1-carboxyvinyltransferase
VIASLTITPGGPLSGTVTVPGDKSITHRAIILSALADGESSINGYCRGEDCVNTVRAFQAMGIAIRETPGQLRIAGKGRWGLTEPERPIDCGNSGTGLRLLAGLLAGQEFFTVLTGDESLRRRPMGRIVNPLREMGAWITGRRGGELAPLAITGRRLRGLAYQSPVASAQIKSCLLLAGLYADGETRISEPQRSRDHTERLFRYFGIPLREEGGAVVVPGRSAIGWGAIRDLSVPGDLSAAAFVIVAASIVPGSEVSIQAVGVNPTRTGILDILAEMGADVTITNRRDLAGEPVADLRVRAAKLRGVRLGAAHIPQMIDELPILCVAAALAEGETVITGAAELRVKESDRIATMAAELKKLGIAVTEQPDGLIIQGRGGGPFTSGVCASYGDHRVAMSLAVAGLRADGPVRIEDTTCIDTSFPGFADLLGQLQRGPKRPHAAGTVRKARRVIAIDGPAGAGKSTAAKLLASRLGYRYLDSGALYRAVAWKVLKAGISPDDERAVSRLLEGTTLSLESSPAAARVLVDGEDVTQAIRAPQVSRAASTVSALAAVREWLIPIQRRIASTGGVVAEGRDMGTRIFPQADWKFFLQADLEVRARRRQAELAQAGHQATFEDTLRELNQRDSQDRSRNLAPLVPATDARVIDTSGLTVDQLLERLLAEMQLA